MSKLDQHLVALLDRQDSVSAPELGRAAGVSRQAAHRFLAAKVERKELLREGRARATRYRAPSSAARPLWSGRYRRQGLEEDRVWNNLAPALAELGPKASEIAHYAVTELVNNAIDHSGAEIIEVKLEAAPHAVRIDVIDDGVGVFAHLVRELGFDDELHAIQELHKGKLTTMPERHTGEGIFFVSKAVDVFEIDSSGLLWIVDNQRRDVAVVESPPRQGSRVGFLLSREPRCSLSELFSEYTDDFAFSRTKTVIKLFSIGVRFVSRSEAKRLLHGLEKFSVVTLDFAGVQGVGQGFADEVFRVWAREHPETELTPIHMIPPVEMMVRRAQSAGASGT